MWSNSLGRADDEGLADGGHGEAAVSAADVARSEGCFLLFLHGTPDSHGSLDRWSRWRRGFESGRNPLLAMPAATVTTPEGAVVLLGGTVVALFPSLLPIPLPGENLNSVGMAAALMAS